MEITQITIEDQKKIDEYTNKAEYFREKKEIESSIDCYQQLLKNTPSFINLYSKKIYRVGLSALENDKLANRFDALYPKLINSLSPFVKHQSTVTNIYHCSVPKAATTWMKNVLSDARVSAYSGMLPFPVEFLRDLNKIPQKTIVTGTFAINFSEFKQIQKPEKYKAFFVMRDPRDLVVSAYFSHKYSHSLTTEHIKETRNILNRVSEEDGIIYTIDTLTGVFQILDSWINGAKNEDRIALFKYEDLTGNNTLSNFRHLFNHCDINIAEKVLTDLIKDHSFEKLTHGRKQGQQDQNSHYRKGVHGDWKNYFNEKIRNKFEEVTGDLVTRLGYAWDGTGALSEIYQTKMSTTNPFTRVESIKSNVSTSVQQQIQLGFNCYQENKLEESKKHYQNSLELLENQIAIPYFYLGCINYRQNNMNEAYDYFKKAIECKSQLVDSYFYLGSICLKKDLLAEAIKYFQKYDISHPNNPDVFYYIGMAYFKQNQFEEAITNYKKSIELNEKIADAYYYLGEIYMKKGMITEGLDYHKKFQNLKQSA